MDTLTTFLTGNSLWGIIAIIVAITLIVGIIKSLFKMVMIVAVIGLILVVFFDFKPQEVIDKGKSLAGTGTELLQGDLGTGLLDKFSEEDFFIKKEDGKTIIKIESLGIEYNLDDLLDQLSRDEQKDLNQILEK